MVQVFGGATGTATANFDRTTIEQNSAADSGGLFAAGVTSWRGGAIRDNTATNRGGGVYVRQTLSLTGTSLQRNTAGQSGGGAFHEATSSATYVSVDVGSDVNVNGPDTFDGDLSSPQSLTGAVGLSCNGSGCASLP
jgi:predicted outer membrane repeat protein